MRAAHGQTQETRKSINEACAQMERAKVEMTEEIGRLKEQEKLEHKKQQELQQQLLAHSLKTQTNDVLPEQLLIAYDRLEKANGNYKYIFNELYKEYGALYGQAINCLRTHSLLVGNMAIYGELLKEGEASKGWLPKSVKVLGCLVGGAGLTYIATLVARSYQQKP